MLQPGAGIFSVIWQNAPQSNQDKQISRYSGQCQERLITAVQESQTNASFMVAGPNWYFYCTIKKKKLNTPYYSSESNRGNMVNYTLIRSDFVLGTPSE